MRKAAFIYRNQVLQMLKLSMGGGKKAAPRIITGKFIALRKML
jgi:hypothetical protein